MKNLKLNCVGLNAENLKFYMTLTLTKIVQLKNVEYLKVAQ